MAIYTSTHTGLEIDNAIDTVDDLVGQVQIVIAAAGYQIVGDFADVTKVEITLENQVYSSKSILGYESALWRPIVALPYTPTGTDPTPGGDETGNWVAVSVGELETIARSLNTNNNNVMYDTDEVTPIVEYIYSKSQQVIYSVPSLAIGKTILSVVGSTLNTTEPASYQLIKINSESLTYELNISSLGALEDTDISGKINYALSLVGKQAKLTLNPGNYIINSDIYILERGRPDIGVFEIDFTGSTFSGTGNVIFDSCKNLSVIGFQAPNQNMILRGVWYSDFRHCKFSELVIEDISGTTYDSSYWDDFYTCQFQTIRRGSAISPANSITFYGVSLRGNAGQGFDQTKDYGLIFEGTGGAANAQNWIFYGGDLSYFNVDIIDNSMTADLEIKFDGVYFDSLTPKYEGLLFNQNISCTSCHYAGKVFGSAELDSATRGGLEIKGDTSSVGWQPNGSYNLIPNGNLSKNLADYTTAFGGPIGQFSNGTITPVDDVNEGLYLNLTVANGDSTFTLCRFRSISIQSETKYTGTIIARNNAAGVRSVNVGFGGQFAAFDIGQEWVVITLADNTPSSLATSDDILFRSTDGLGYNIDVKYIGMVMGSNPSIVSPQHPVADKRESVSTNQVLVGNHAVESDLPHILSGNGSPEGVVTAPRGSMYLRSDGIANTVLWIKESGGGNTGWASK